MINFEGVSLENALFGLVSYVLGFKLPGDGHQPNSNTFIYH